MPTKEKFSMKERLNKGNMWISGYYMRKRIVTGQSVVPDNFIPVWHFF